MFRRALMVVALPLILLAAFCLHAVPAAAAAPEKKNAPKTAEEIIRTHSCMGCHKIPGIAEATGTIGPSLAGLGDKPRIAGDRLRNTRENMKRWLRNPKAVKETLMPNTGLTEPELEILADFLEKL